VCSHIISEIIEGFLIIDTGFPHKKLQEYFGLIAKEEEEEQYHTGCQDCTFDVGQIPEHTKDLTPVFLPVAYRSTHLL
jgi:hypothetical protein